MKYPLVFCLFFGVAVGAIADTQTAAQHYLTAETAWKVGAIDTAISEWREALKLKPDSSITKDRLIVALLEKVKQLETGLAAKTAELQKLTVPEDKKPLVLSYDGSKDGIQPRPIQNQVYQPKVAVVKPRTTTTMPEGIALSEVKMGRRYPNFVNPVTTARNAYNREIIREANSELTVEGYVTNNRTTTVSSVYISMALFDRKGLQVGDTIVSVHSILPRTTARFSQAVNDPGGVESLKVVEVSAH